MHELYLYLRRFHEHVKLLFVILSRLEYSLNINISISFSSTVTIPSSANKIWFKKVSKEILKLVLIYVTIPRSLIFLFFGNTKTIYFIFCIIYQNIILRTEVDMILTSLVSHFYMISKKKTKNYASYRILLSICTSANSGKIQGYLLKDALDWKN